MIKNIVIIVLFIILAVLAYDFLPSFLNWLGRIKIGRVTDDAQWISSIKSVNVKWLMKGAPRVRRNEYQRLLLLKDLREVEKSTPIKYWQDAALLKGLTNDESDKQIADKFLDRYIDIFTGEWKSLPTGTDVAMLAYEIMSCSHIDNRTVEPAMNHVASMLKEYYDKYGSIPYNVAAEDIRFVDAVGMVCPFLIKYAKEYNRPEYIDIALKQIKQYNHSGINEKTKLPFHCFDISNGNQLGICGWGRGCGWWALGLADSLKELMQFEGFNREKVVLLKLNIDFLDVMKNYIGDNGAVNRMVLNDSLPDSCAASMLAYCFAYLFTLTNNAEYKLSAEKIKGYLKTATRRNGVVDYSQGDTMGIGYYSHSLSVIPAAQGFAVAAFELLS